MRIVIALGALVVAGLVLLVSGCGGSNSTSSLTKAEFIEQADAICENADGAQLAAVARVTRRSSGNKAADERELLIQGLEPVQRQAEEINALGAPSGDEAQVSAIVVGMEEAVGGTEEAPDKVVAVFAKVNKLAKAYGLKACSEGP
jgi:hypothetical protein